MTRANAHKQRGAALAIALLMLVIITLLGVAAVRATQVELKLSQNAESRMAAIQAADSMVAYVLNNNTGYLPVNDSPNFIACVRAANLSTPLFTCNTTDTVIDPATATPLLRDHGYAQVRRETPLFVEVNVLRDEGLSAKNYDFARFTVTGGYDRSGDSLSAAEVTVGILRLHPKIAGVSYEP